MRHCLIAVLILMAAASAATRVYDIEPYRNCNGKVAGDQYHGVSQSFVCTASELLFAEFFVGDSNLGGQYEFDVNEFETGRSAYHGTKGVAGQHYEYVRCDSLAQLLPLIKGKEYVLKITHSAGESLNYYYSPANPYKYGHLNPQLGDQSHPEEYFPNDLCARIEGLSRSLTECKAERRRMKDEL
jgi:hypothetical protein